MDRITFTILGEAASKANSRKLVTIADHPAFIKSDKARAFEAAASVQIPAAARQRLTGPVAVKLRMYYATERPDLDEAVLLDVMQDRWARTKPSNPIVPGQRVLLQPGVYRNDRQVRVKLVLHAIDASNPRVEVEVVPLSMQQVSLLEEEFDAVAF